MSARRGVGAAPLLALPFLLGLAGCIDTAPRPLAEDHPANPAAPAGWVAEPNALADYKTPDSFAADAVAPPAGGMAGMAHMRHEGMK
jgi:hypothetical protein